MTKKLIIISVDALGADDLKQTPSELHMFNFFKEHGTHIRQVEAIYPSLTYPSHVTLVTGVYPKKHGVVNNTLLQPERKSPDWYWYDRFIKRPTLYSCAEKEGLKTAAFLWPVTAKSTITYNIAEIFPNRIWTNQAFVSLSASSPFFLLAMNAKYGYLRDGIKQPQLDDFVTACAVDTIKHKQPDLTLIHLVDMDSMRHAHGVSSREAKEALLRQNKRIGDIVNATREAGTYDETTFVVLGDHYQIDVTNMIRLNVLFASKGWLDVNPDGTVADNWQVYAKSCDGSCYIYCRQQTTVEPSEILDALKLMIGIEAIYTSDEVSEMGATENCTFMLEAERGFYFVDQAIGELVSRVQTEHIGEPDLYQAVHGFSPLKEDYSTTMLVMGPDIKKNHHIETSRLVDAAPTFAEILGLESFPHDTDGVCIADMFV